MFLLKITPLDTCNIRIDMRFVKIMNFDVVRYFCTVLYVTNTYTVSTTRKCTPREISNFLSFSSIDLNS